MINVRTAQFNLERSSRERIEKLLTDLHRDGFIDYWGPCFPQSTPKYYEVEFGPKTNLVMVILQVNSRMLLEA